MYKLKQNNITVMLAPLSDCLKRLRKECKPETTVKELFEAGWYIEPASEGVIKEVLKCFR